MKTPWGESQVIDKFAEGIEFVSTAGHGGMKLSADRNSKVPYSWRQNSFNGDGLRGWYEEDCDVALVIMTFPEFFKAEIVEEAKKMMVKYHPDCDLSLVA